MTPFSAKEPVRQLLLEDVSDNADGLRCAFDLIVQGYTRLASSDITGEMLREILCNDIYHRAGLARTLLLTGLVGESDVRQPLGTVRILPSSERVAAAYGVPPLEAMELMAPADGWSHFQFQEFSLDRTVEGGRIVVGPVCRSEAGRRWGLPALILRELVAGGYRTAVQKFGKTQYWGILPDYMVTRMEPLGFRIIRAPSVCCRKQQNARLFQTFGKYWLESNPSFCRVILEPDGQRFN